jgi:hypothetical protein
MAGTQFRISLNLWNNVVNPTTTSLVLGEERTLSDAEIQELNSAMERMNAARQEVLSLVQTARNRLRAQLRELRQKPTRR